MEEDFYNPFMAKRISRDRYLQITKYLHMQIFSLLIRKMINSQSKFNLKCNSITK